MLAPLALADVDRDFLKCFHWNLLLGLISDRVTVRRGLLRVSALFVVVLNVAKGR